MSGGKDTSPTHIFLYSRAGEACDQFISDAPTFLLLLQPVHRQVATHTHIIVPSLCLFSVSLTGCVHHNMRPRRYRAVPTLQLGIAEPVS